MQAILFYIKASGNQHESQSPLSSQFDAWLHKKMLRHLNTILAR